MALSTSILKTHALVGGDGCEDPFISHSDEVANVSDIAVDYPVQRFRDVKQVEYMGIGGTKMKVCMPTNNYYYSPGWASLSGDYASDEGYRLRIFSKHEWVNSGMRSPIIISQGFDPEYKHDAQRFGMNDFEDQLKTLGHPERPREVTPNAADNVLSTLINNGHEVIMVLYKKPNISIKANSTVFEEVLKKVNSWRMSWYYGQSSADPIRIIGPSMGGLISRMAIQNFPSRNNGWAIPIRNFIAFDSPNLGAVIPMSAQAFLYYVKEDDAEAGTLYNNLVSPAAKEMLFDYIQTGKPTGNDHRKVSDYLDPNSSHGQFHQELNGWSKISNLYAWGTLPGSYDTPWDGRGEGWIRLAAIINGSGYHRDQGIPDHTSGASGTIQMEIVGVDKRVGTFRLLSDGNGDCDAGSCRRHEGVSYSRVFYGDLINAYDWNFWYRQPVFLENSPGGVRNTYYQIQRKFTIDRYFNQAFGGPTSAISGAADYPGASFIPSVSGLGLIYRDVNDPNFIFHGATTNCWQSIFDHLYVPYYNQEHVLLTTENKTWFEKELYSSYEGCSSEF